MPCWSSLYHVCLICSVLYNIYKDCLLFVFSSIFLNYFSRVELAKISVMNSTIFNIISLSNLFITLFKCPKQHISYETGRKSVYAIRVVGLTIWWSTLAIIGKHWLASDAKLECNGSSLKTCERDSSPLNMWSWIWSEIYVYEKKYCWDRFCLCSWSYPRYYSLICLRWGDILENQNIYMRQ